ncbi:hypothetical protein SAMN04487996_12499 [Dyadobacter soli]|uniref:Uncharacterized protein n=1 Tax=Dyadobacter soli TaxID=659014 RepID=A0A1G7XSG1_9BACT|nr:hypothetical protein SAMN04487996_12499 [Dyadobacter soli]
MFVTILTVRCTYKSYGALHQGEITKVQRTATIVNKSKNRCIAPIFVPKTNSLIQKQWDFQV